MSVLELRWCAILTAEEDAGQVTGGKLGAEFTVSVSVPSEELAVHIVWDEAVKPPIHSVLACDGVEHGETDAGECHGCRTMLRGESGHDAGLGWENYELAANPSSRGQVRRVFVRTEW